MSDQVRTREQILRDVKRVNDRVRRASDALDKVLAERRALYREARTHPEPVPYMRIARAAGTTEGAVIQVCQKAMNDEPS